MSGTELPVLSDDAILDELVPTVPPPGRTHVRTGARGEDGRDRFPGGGWSITQARTLAAELRPLAANDGERIGLEMFTGLCGYLDELGGRTFDQQWTATERARARALITRLVRTSSAGRPDRPVNASVSLVRGRWCATQLEGLSGWRGGLGRVLVGTYAYLDDLHGSPGLTRLLTRPERRTVAAALHPVADPTGPS